MSRKWEGWEYYILNQNLCIEETARRLGRSVEEVREKIREYCEDTLERWYRRRRMGVSTDTPEEHVGQTRGFAPETAGRIVALARKICRENFRRLHLPDEDIQDSTRKALEHALRYFRPDAGNQNVPIHRRFEQFFVLQFRRQLLEEYRLSQARAAQQCYLNVNDLEHPVDTTAETKEALNSWSKLLINTVLKRSNPLALEVIEQRLSGKQVEEIARERRLSPKTLSNRYGVGRLQELVQKEVRGLIRALPPGHLQGIVAHLRWEAGLTPAAIAQLFCLSPEELAGPLHLADRGVVPIPGREKAMKLLERFAPRWIAN